MLVRLGGSIVAVALLCGCPGAEVAQDEITMGDEEVATVQQASTSAFGIERAARTCLEPVDVYPYYAYGRCGTGGYPVCLAYVPGKPASQPYMYYFVCGEAG